jgi:multiple sugar transport system substrate-binding protein
MATLSVQRIRSRRPCRRRPIYRSNWHLALALLAALLLAGCGRSARQGEARAADGKIVIDFWNGFTGPDGKTMEKLVRQFQEENPDIRVRMQIIPWGTYYDKVTLSLAYGGAPELFVVHAARLPEFASFGVLRAMDELVSSADPPLPVADFAPVPWEGSFYQGKQYGLPLDVHPIGLYYNTRLFEQAGIVDERGKARPPVTWDEFLTAARKLTKDTDNDGHIDQWGFVYTLQTSNWYTFAYQFGSGVLTLDGRKCAMASPGSLAASHRMRDLIYKHRVAPKPEGIDAWLAFRQGKAAMAMEGIYMLASLEEQKGLPYAGAPAPRFGPKRAAWGGSHILCQPAAIRPEAGKAAWRLTRFLSDHSLQWAKGGQVPVRLSILRSAEFQALPVQSQFAKQLSFVQYEPLTPKANAIGPFVAPAIEAVLLDLQTPEAAMQDACRRIEQVLERP